MTDDEIRLQFGELNASEMRLARAIVGWHEREQAKLRAAADGLAEYTERLLAHGHADDCLWLNRADGECDCGNAGAEAAIAAYQATKKP